MAVVGRFNQMIRRSCTDQMPNTESALPDQRDNMREMQESKTRPDVPNRPL